MSGIEIRFKISPELNDLIESKRNNIPKSTFLKFIIKQELLKKVDLPDNLLNKILDNQNKILKKLKKPKISDCQEIDISNIAKK